MSAANSEIGLSHRIGASNSQSGYNSEPEIVHTAEAGLSDS